MYMHPYSTPHTQQTIPLDLLSVDQKTILADLGVPRRIDPRDSNWNKNFHELARYKDLFGDVNVPVKWKDARAKEHGFVVAFSAWVHQQLVLYKMGLLTPRQVDVRGSGGGGCGGCGGGGSGSGGGGGGVLHVCHAHSHTLIHTLTSSHPHTLTPTHSLSLSHTRTTPPLRW